MTRSVLLLAAILVIAALIGSPTPASVPALPPPSAGVLVGTEPFNYAATPRTHIFTMKPDGGDKKILTDNYGNRTPTWSCDGKQIVYGAGGPTQIWIMNADGSNKKQLTSLSTGANLPSISCDGKISFVSQSRKGKPQVFMMDSLTSLPRPVTADDTFNYASSISPDGKKIAFTRHLNDKHRQIFTIDVDGSNERQLTFPTDPNAPDANAPAWSPNSKQIAFFQGFEEKSGGPPSKTPDIRYLAVMNADGSDRRWLTNCSAGVDLATPGQCADDPAWSPDGKWIIYSSHFMRTWIIRSDGSSKPREFLNFLLLFGNGGRRPWSY
jgi:Tol biopolymer transport system component